MRKKKKSGKNTSLAIIFLFLILGTIALSFLVKVFFVVKSSRFGQGNNYSIFIKNKENNKILTFDKNRNSITLLSIQGRVDNIYKFAEVPLDSTSEGESIDFSSSPFQIILDAAFRVGNKNSNLNAFDAIRMLLMARLISPGNVFEKEISKGYPETQRDGISVPIFSDTQIEKEREEIEVVNGTEESGVGNRYARLISNMGGSVVLVSTGTGSRESVIYSEKNSYTAKRLSQVLNFPIVKGKMSKFAEITVVIGDNHNKLSKY
ncbi:MAG: hypothetical protein A3H79_02545 [Candidatus Levybacteria bacterium RIFCSPLOWO2_02_FULL_36_8b]|nr:MAG: hypothetical protein A3H79_02545 [Candidatus Levybacteria bacterium RIFCSPLOWO2_02_FULL_36_8b]